MFFKNCCIFVIWMKEAFSIEMVKQAIVTIIMKIMSVLPVCVAGCVEETTVFEESCQQEMGNSVQKRVVHYLTRIPVWKT